MNGHWWSLTVTARECREDLRKGLSLPRYTIFQLAEVAVPRDPFRGILELMSEIWVDGTFIPEILGNLFLLLQGNDSCLGAYWFLVAALPGSRPHAPPPVWVPRPYSLIPADWVASAPTAVCCPP